MSRVKSNQEVVNDFLVKFREMSGSYVRGTHDSKDRNSVTDLESIESNE